MAKKVVQVEQVDAPFYEVVVERTVVMRMKVGVAATKEVVAPNSGEFAEVQVSEEEAASYVLSLPKVIDARRKFAGWKIVEDTISEPVVKDVVPETRKLLRRAR